MWQQSCLVMELDELLGWDRTNIPLPNFTRCNILLTSSVCFSHQTHVLVLESYKNNFLTCNILLIYAPCITRTRYAYVYQ